MKKTSLALAVASALGASAANAAIMAEYANGLVVPRVYFNSAESQDTAIALTTCHAGTVYWAWYNTGSVKQADGQFNMTTNDQRSFTWSDPEFSGFTGSLEDTEGYMTFFLDTTGDGQLSLNDSTCLAGNAFFVDLSDRDDVAFVPTFPMNLAWGDLRTTGSLAAGDLTAAFPLLQPNGVTDIVGLWAGARPNDTLHMRYFVDFVPNSGDGTTIYIWSANVIGGTFSIQQFDNTQSRRSLSMTLGGELNILDVETSGAFSSLAQFTDGFFEWILPNDPTYNGVVSWSVVDSDRFQATQTLLNPIFRPHITTNTPGVYNPGERFNIFEYYNPQGLFDPTGTVGDQLGEGANMVGFPPAGSTAPAPVACSGDAVQGDAEEEQCQ